MLAKLGCATAGVVVGLVALAPAATAMEDRGHRHGGSDDERTCTTSAGDATATSEITGDAVAAAVTQLPTGGNVMGNVECSDVLSNNDNNFSHNFNDNDNNRFG